MKFMNKNIHFINKINFSINEKKYFVSSQKESNKQFHKIKR